MSGLLWETENAGKAFDEINQISAGHNGGWIQVMGPMSRMDRNPANPITGCGEFREIETLWGIGRTVSSSPGGGIIVQTLLGPRGLQQGRFLSAPHPNYPNSGVLTCSQADATAALFMMPGAHLADPSFSWKHVNPPAGMGFIKGNLLGPQYNGDLVVGSAVARDAAGTVLNPNVGNGYQGTPFFSPYVQGSFLRPQDNAKDNFGHLYIFQVTGDRRHVANNSNNTKLGFEDPQLEDLVADNGGFQADGAPGGQDDWITEQSSILFGKNFGIVTDIVTGPDGHLYVLSLARLLVTGQSATGRIYMISK